MALGPCTYLAFCAMLQVMDNDSLSSIAVKFETTPAELARLNKKPLGVNSTIFTGEVSYGLYCVLWDS